MVPRRVGLDYLSRMFELWRVKESLNDSLWNLIEKFETNNIESDNSIFPGSSSLPFTHLQRNYYHRFTTRNNVAKYHFHWNYRVDAIVHAQYSSNESNIRCCVAFDEQCLVLAARPSKEMPHLIGEVWIVERLQFQMNITTIQCPKTKRHLSQEYQMNEWTHIGKPFV